MQIIVQLSALVEHYFHHYVLTFRAALAEFFTEVLSRDTGTRGVTRLPWVVTWLVIIHVIG